MTFSPVHNHWQGPPSVQEADRSQQLAQTIQRSGVSSIELYLHMLACTRSNRANEGTLRKIGPASWGCRCRDSTLPQNAGPSKFETDTNSFYVSDCNPVVISMRTVRARRTGGCWVVRAAANVFGLRSARSTVAGVLLWSLKRVGVM